MPPILTTSMQAPNMDFYGSKYDATAFAEVTFPVYECYSASGDANRSPSSDSLHLKALYDNRNGIKVRRNRDIIEDASKAVTINKRNSRDNNKIPLNTVGSALRRGASLVGAGALSTADSQVKTRAFSEFPGSNRGTKIPATQKIKGSTIVSS